MTRTSRMNQKNIFTPLGMESTQGYLAEVNVANHAIPYTYISDGATFEPRVPRSPISGQPLRTGELFAHCLYSFPNYPDGLIRASVRDLSRFLIAYIKGGVYGNKRILKQETIRTMPSVEHFGRGLYARAK